MVIQREAMGCIGHIMGSIQWDVMGWNGKWDRVCNRMYNQQNDFWPCPKAWGSSINGHLNGKMMIVNNGME